MAKKMITLKSSDGDIFEIEETAAKQSKMIRFMIKDGCADDIIPIQNVDSEILIKIIDYCKRHATDVNSRPFFEFDLNYFCSSISEIFDDDNFLKDDRNSNSWPSDGFNLNQPSSSSSASMVEDDLRIFDKKFVKVDWDTLARITVAANYLEIESLLDLTTRAVVKYIKKKPLEEIDKLFKIENDFTPEEEAEMRRENPWAFT